MELKDLHTSMMTTFESLKGMIDRQNEEIAKFGEAKGETKGVEERIQAKLDELETKMNRTGPGSLATGGDVEVEAEKAKKKSAFLTYARRGEKGLNPDEAKLLSISDDATGGYLAPVEMQAEIIRGVTEYSPIRGLARIRHTSSRSVDIPKRTGTFAATWVGEVETRGETDGLRYGMERIDVDEMSAVVYVTMQDLEDSAFDLEAEIVAEMGEQFGVAEGAAFVNGSGVKKPEGVLTNADLGFEVSGSAAAITADGLIDLIYGVKGVYARNGVFILNRSTIRAIRKLKDANNQYLWLPGLTADQPNTILGHRYEETPDMPSIAAGTFPVVFGDFKRGYQIVDRLAIAITRDNLTRAENGQIKIVGRKRVGGQVVLAEALRKLKISA